MNARKNTMFVIMLIGMICFVGLSLARDVEDETMLMKEYSLDHTRATILEQSKNLNALANLVEEIQNKWSKKDKRMYGALMVNTLHSWESAYRRADKKPPMNIIRQYANQVLSTYDPNKPDNISIETEFALVSILHGEYIYMKGERTDEEWASYRRKGAERFLRAWKRLENAIDDDWDPNDIPEANVSPPKGIGIPGIPGMSPELIKDPVLRAEYEKAIEKNREKIEIRNEQLKLRNTNNRYHRILEKYLVSTYSIPPYANEELSKYVNGYTADEKTRSRILDAVKKNIEAQAEKTPKEPDKEDPPATSTQR